MSRAILKNISVSGTVRRLRRCLLLTSFVAMASALLPLFAPSLAQAADTLPGDACTGAELNHIRSNAGKASDGTSYNLVYCNGTNWVGMLSGDATGIKVPSSAALTGDISASITAAQNNYNPTGLSTATVLRLSTDASRDITGLAGGADGRTLVILNVGSNPIVLKNQSASSTAANRFAIGSDITLSADQSVSIIYDSTSQRWRAGALPFDQGVGGGGPTASDGYFVLTFSQQGNLGNLAGANSICLSELTSGNWKNKSIAQANGQIIAGKIRAFLCNGTTCQNGQPSTKYYFASIPDPSAGGASFTTNASGYGPNNNEGWWQADRFSRGEVFGFWSGRAAGGSSSTWPNTVHASRCTNWGSSSSGQYGVQGNITDSSYTDQARWSAWTTSCDTWLSLICFVDP